MKKLVNLAFALVLALLLAACGDNTGSDNSGNNSTTPPASNNGGDTAPTDSETPEATGETTSETPDATGETTSETPDVAGETTSETPDATKETTRPPASAELSAEWNSFQFELEGKIYTLPMRYSELEANGWTAENDRDIDETLEAGKYILNYMTIVYSNKENSEISIQFANLGDEDMPLRECYVSGIQLAENSWSENTVLYYPGGFTIGSTKEEVEALYGEPSDIQELSGTVEYKYQTQIYDDVIFTFNKDTGKIEKMRMSNIYLP